jgi:hypothetical protein
MKGNLISFLLIITINSFGQGLKSSLQFKANLNSDVTESSGLLFIDGTLWTFNDSGGEPEIYAIDTSNGNLLRTVTIINAVNKDWEAITCDENFVYIGDVGNNAGKRDKLYIYCISRKMLRHKEVNIIKADTITFNYADKYGKKALMHKSMYDCESMFCLHDSIFIINKNWINQSLAIIYAMPAIPGHYSLKPYSYLVSDGLICDAAVNADKSTLAVVGYNDFLPFLSLYKIKSVAPFVLEKFFDTEFPKYHGLQTEGITFVNKKDLMISCEGNRFYRNSLFRFIR